jgi:hypothetical protein
MSLKACFALLLALAGTSVAARSLSLDADRLHDPYANAQGLHVVLEEHDGTGSLRIQASRLDVPALALTGRIDWACTLVQTTDGARACSGKLVFQADAATAQEAELTARVDGQRIELLFVRDIQRALVTIPLADDGPARVGLTRIPIEWLKAPVARAWRGGELRGGIVDIEASLDRLGKVDAHCTVDALSFNTTDGTVAGEEMSFEGNLALARDGQTSHVIADATLTGGLLQVGALHLQLPDAPVGVGLDAIAREDGIWNVARFTWNDPDTLTFEASGEFAPAATAPLRTLDVRVDLARFPQASSRYAKSIQAGIGLGQTALRGDLAGHFSFDGNAPRQVALTTAAFDVDDGANGIVVKGLHGGIDWSASGDRPPLALGWKSARMGGLAVSAADGSWASSDGALQLRGPLRIKLLGGSATLKNTVVHPFPAAGERLRSDFSLQGIGYDSADARFAASGIVADGSLRISTDAHGLRLQSDVGFRGGEFLADPLYVKLPHTPVKAAIDARWVDAVWHLDRFDWTDPGTLAFSAVAELSPADPKPLHALTLDLREASLRPAINRYAHAWLASRGYGDLQADGSLSGKIAFDAGRLHHFALAAHSVDVRDAAGRFALAGVDGGIEWDAQADAPATTLGWQSLEFYRVPFGAMTASLQSREGRVLLTNPVDIDVLGGKVRVEKLSLQPDSPRGERYAGSFAIAAIDMKQLSTALGWPQFPGNLSGGIPEIEFVGDRIELHGGLDLYVFDGHLGISGMSLEHPFSDLPALAADVHFENFDLQQLTSAFSFGGMSGRLAGTIDRLSLLNWSPVAFDAWLRTAGGGRMSYKAISDVTAVAGGGGGLSDNMQTVALKLVNTFGYGRLGLRCRLADNVCTMGGIDPIPIAQAEKVSGDDYTIVEGAGLPRISIVGHRRRVDWPTLMRRLDAAVQGQAPVIQ